MITCVDAILFGQPCVLSQLPVSPVVSKTELNAINQTISKNDLRRLQLQCHQFHSLLISRKRRKDKQQDKTSTLRCLAGEPFSLLEITELFVGFIGATVAFFFWAASL